MAREPFDRHIRRLAADAGLKLAHAGEDHAKLTFDMGSQHIQTVLIIPFQDVWEFSCQTLLIFPSLTEIPPALMSMLLVQNGRRRRGHWCIEAIEDSYTITLMSNVHISLLTPEELGQLCRAIATSVEDLENEIRGA
jgi:hypothetical protein